MKVSGNKILVEYDLPTDYGLSRIMEQKGLPLLNGDLFYVITKNKKFVVREYLEDGFTCEDKVIDTPYSFTIVGSAVGGMGLWEVTYRVDTDSGIIKNIYEMNAVIKDMC
jgi:hypothetical protein